jgi:AbrB family looped-hinge helix DNA binding protein
MKLTSKGQVTVPQHIRAAAGIQPHSEVEFSINADGDVVLKKLATVSPIRAALDRVAGSANAPEFKGMTTDDYMRFIRGE